MKQIFGHRLSIAIFSFLLGCVLTSFLNYSIHKTERLANAPMGFAKIFSQMNPFREDPMVEDFFSEAENNMLQLDHLNNLGSPGVFNHGVGDVTQREDDRYIYLDIDLKGQKPKEFKVNVQQGQVTVSGLIESQENSPGFSGTVTSSFHRSFPAPDNAKVSTYKLEQSEDKITIKFEKANS